MNSIFITGANGYIARNFIRRINRENYKTIYCLIRSQSKIANELFSYENIEFIQGDINDTSTYAHILDSVSTVIHFAAVTGKARPEEYFRTNKDGTEQLINQCRVSGVKNILYISSISVKYPDISRYYYAQSKKVGENIVKESGLRYAIVRPTIVIGKGSALLESIMNLASRRIIPVFGDGKAKIQPIHIDDLNDCLLSILQGDYFRNEIYEFGGPEIIAIEAFLKRICLSCYNKKAKTIHIPMGPLILFLKLFETLAYDYVPVTIGQLSAFRYDSTIAENAIFRSRFNEMKNIDEMLSSSTENTLQSDPSA